MTKKEEPLCAPRDKLTTLLDLGKEFLKIIKDEAALAKEVGLDTTEIDKLIKDSTALFRVSTKRLKV